MRPMGRPRQSNKDLPVGMYRDAAGRITIKVFTPEHRARMGGKATMSFGRDLVAARLKWAEAFGFRDHEPPADGTLAQLFERFLEEDLVSMVPGPDGKPRPKYARAPSASTRARPASCCRSTAPRSTPAARPRRPPAASSARWT
jgi:hypothetical protein